MRTRIRELRAKNGLTQGQLADLVGVRRETISLLEKGRYNPSLMLAYKIAVELGARIDEVFLFDDQS